jgi:hypothetical protein
VNACRMIGGPVADCNAGVVATRKNDLCDFWISVSPTPREATIMSDSSSAVLSAGSRSERFLTRRTVWLKGGFYRKTCAKNDFPTEGCSPPIRGGNQGEAIAKAIL